MQDPKVEGLALEFRVVSAQSRHVTALLDHWMPATVARVTEEVRTLARLKDKTAVLEVRWRPRQPKRRTNGPAA